jgi:hypothetical protein
MRKPVTPTQSLLAGAAYNSAAATDVTRTWRKYGWLPKEEADAQAQAKVAMSAAKERSHARSRH